MVQKNIMEVIIKKWYFSFCQEILVPRKFSTVHFNVSQGLAIQNNKFQLLG